jgi:3-methyladenine DNA glycosylase/8-oxoguanine DNA glycosylase
MTDLKKRATEIDRRLGERYPGAKCSLDFTNPFELLIATILSAQSTDARVNIVTKSLFRKYPNPAAFANASLVENWSSFPAWAARPRTWFSAKRWESMPASSSTRTSAAFQDDWE